MKKKMKFISHRNWRCILILVLLTGLVLSGLFQSAAAQITRTNPPVAKPTPPQRKTIVFRGNGREQSDAEADRLTQIAALEPLTPAEKRNLLAGAMSESGVTSQLVGTVNTYVTLNSRTPFVADKGHLVFNNPDYVGYLPFPNGGFLPRITFKGVNKPENVRLRIKPARAGQWLLVDCVVFNLQTGFLSGGVFKMTGPDGTITEKNIDGSGHLLSILVAQNTAWQTITIEKTSGAWGFFSCEVTEPN